jgi:hypothetical protein
MVLLKRIEFLMKKININNRTQSLEVLKNLQIETPHPLSMQIWVITLNPAMKKMLLHNLEVRVLILNLQPLKYQLQQGSPSLSSKD